MRKVLHIDCDCFFAAVEMRENPQLCHVPIAIGGHSDRRGVISTCNYPARKWGIHSAMATAQALKKCPDLILLPGNMALYREVSQQVMVVRTGFGG
jgi:DNA polymerase-4